MEYQASTSTLTTLGNDVEKAAHRSLDLLKAIESTLDALCYDEKVYNAFAGFAHQALDRIRKMKPIKAIDPDGTVAETLLKAQTATKAVYERLMVKHRSAVKDVRLTEEDGIAGEYQQLITIVADLHDCLNDLRWAVGEHDAELYAARGPVLTSIEDIEKHLS